MICRRYPGTKPSEYLDIESKENSFLFDSALATRADLLEKDLQMLNLESILETINNVSRSLGNNKVKPINYKPMLLGKDTEKKELSLNDVIQSLGGSGVVIERKKK